MRADPREIVSRLREAGGRLRRLTVAERAAAIAGAAAPWRERSHPPRARAEELMVAVSRYSAPVIAAGLIRDAFLKRENPDERLFCFDR